MHSHTLKSGVCASGATALWPLSIPLNPTLHRSPIPTFTHTPLRILNFHIYRLTHFKRRAALQFKNYQRVFFDAWRAAAALFLCVRVFENVLVFRSVWVSRPAVWSGSVFQREWVRRSRVSTSQSVECAQSGRTSLLFLLNILVIILTFFLAAQFF